MISNNDCWDSKDKKIINLKRAERNAEAVTLGQMTDITNEKFDTNNLLTQTLKSRLVFTYLVIVFTMTMTLIRIKSLYPHEFFPWICLTALP